MKKKVVVSGVSEFNVEIADNGFIVSYSGEDDTNDWASSKRVVADFDDLGRVIKEIVEKLQ